MKINKNTLFIVLMAGEFDTFHRRIHIKTMADFFYPSPILVINRPIDPIITMIKKKYRYKEPIIKKLSSNLYIMSPILPIYDQLILNSGKFIKKLNYLFFKKQFKQLLKDNSWTDYQKIIWTMHPDLNDYINLIDSDKIIFDMYDDFIVPSARRNSDKRELELINRSDLIVTISKYLKDKKINLYPKGNFINISNGIAFDLFNKKTFDLQDKLINIKRPIIGYVGNIKKLMDQELMSYIIEQRPNYSFVFIGSGDKIESIEKFNNTYFLGNIKYENLPHYLNAFNVGFIPYKVGDAYSLAISPMKLYEYLAANIYVVSNPIPEVIDFSTTSLGQKMVSIGYTKEDFLSHIDYFVSKPKITLTDEELYSISWENRFDTLFSELEKRNII